MLQSLNDDRHGHVDLYGFFFGARVNFAYFVVFEENCEFKPHAKYYVISSSHLCTYIKRHLTVLNTR